MKRIRNSGYRIQPGMSRFLLNAFERTLGKQKFDKLCESVSNSIGYQDAFDRLSSEGLDFVVIAALVDKLEEVYGKRGGRGLGLRIGQEYFGIILDRLRGVAGIGNLIGMDETEEKKIAIGLRSISTLLTDTGDHIFILNKKTNAWYMDIYRSTALFQEQKADIPSCYIMTGFFQTAVNTFSGTDEFTVNETKCVNAGDDFCEFHIEKTQHVHTLV